MEIALPANDWHPRPHQEKLWRYLERGGKRAVAVWHRRAGKDEVCLHHAAVQAAERPGNYWHCTPEYQQGRKAIWTAINSHTGRRRIDEAFPPQIRESTQEHEMFIRFVNGSTWQVIGSDRYDATVGSGVAGIVYSEWALANPSAWGYHRPILEENNGWAAFITTPRGRNHARDMYEYARRAPGWFSEILTARDTGMLDEEQLRAALDEYCTLYGEDVGRAQFEQEYLCSFNAAILGAYYQLEMAAVRAEERIVAELEHDPERPVHTAWDIGVSDDTSIWWFQVNGPQIYVLDFYTASGVGVEHYAEELAARAELHGWKTGTCFVPHDAKVKEWGSGRTRIETMQRLGLAPMLVRNANIEDGISAARRTLPLCLFHERCEDVGLAALEQYRRQWDDERKCYKPLAVHDWTSHPADAFRYLGLAWRSVPGRRVSDAPIIRGWVIPPPAEPRRGGIRI
jgi:phage terminase large subunit